MKVFIENIMVKEGKTDPSYHYYMITGKLQSGIKITIKDLFYDLRQYVGQHVEMLLSVMRSPYLEAEQGIESVFLPFEHYSIELIDELAKNQGVKETNNDDDVILKGKYMEQYDGIPEKWSSLVEHEYFQTILKARRVMKTEDGIFLLEPWHLTKKIPLEEFPPEITMGIGTADLMAWHPFSVSE